MAVDQSQAAAFEDPSQGYQELEPGTYVLKVRALRPCEPGQFGWLAVPLHCVVCTPNFGG